MLTSFVVSCNSSLNEADSLDLSQTPLQTVENMFAVRTRDGVVSMRMESPVMLHFETDSSSYDTFPQGLSVYAYTEDGLLETVMVSNDARHYIDRKDKNKELWEAFGNVVIHNVIKLETMETDTIYWDQGKNEIYTDCYVKMYSGDGFMQGYGMRSDDRARNARINVPFNAYLVTERDTTKVMIDSVNFIGPFKKK